MFTVKDELRSIKINTYYTVIPLARKYRSEGLCQMAEDLYKQAVAVARSLNEIEPILLIDALYELASYYEFQAKNNEAELLWQEIIKYQEYFSANNPIYIQSVFSLAQLHEKAGNLTKAEELYKNLLQKQESELGDESQDICPTLDQLASFYCRQEKYSLAETILLRVLVIKEFYFGTCSAEINYTIDSLIHVFQKLKKWRLAEYMLNGQKSILSVLHGNKSLCVASCSLKLAQFQIETKEINKAIENLSFTIDIYKNNFGELAPAVIALQNKLENLLIYGMDMNFSPFLDEKAALLENNTANFIDVLKPDFSLVSA